MPKKPKPPKKPKFTRLGPGVSRRENAAGLIGRAQKKQGRKVTLVRVLIPDEEGKP